MFSIVDASRVQADFPHLGLVRCVYCVKLLVEKRGKCVYFEVRGQRVEKRVEIFNLLF